MTNIYQQKITIYEKEIKHLENELAQLENNIKEIPQEEYLKEKEKIEYYIKRESEKVKQLKEFEKTYNEEIEKINSLKESANVVEERKNKIIKELNNLENNIKEITEEEYLSEKEILNYYKQKEEEQLKKIECDINLSKEKLTKGINDLKIDEIQKENIIEEITKIEILKENKIVIDKKQEEEIIKKQIEYKKEIEKTKKEIKYFENLLKILKENPQMMSEEETIETKKYFNESIENLKNKLNELYSKIKKENEDSSLLNDLNNESRKKQIVEDNTKELSKIEEDNIEKPIEVVSTKKWKTDKKKVLIALGLVAVTIAIVVALQALIPAIVAASQATTISTMASSMINNAGLWHAVSLASEQAALHGANTALASLIGEMTGNAAIFNSVSGVWTFGGVELGTFAANAAQTAATAAAKVTSLSNLTGALSIGGLGLTAVGTLVTNKSNEYYRYNNKIKSLKSKIKNGKTIPNSVFFNMSGEIHRNDNLTTKEKNKLIIKLSKMITKKEELDDVIYDEEGYTNGRKVR